MKQNFTRSIILLVVFCVAFIFTKAQNIDQHVMASAGGFHSSANGSISFTVGESSMIQTFSAGGTILTQGFQQPNDNLTGLLELSKTGFGAFAVYPNPAVDNVWFGFEFPDKGKVSLTLYNSLGQKLSDVYEADYSSGKTTSHINLSELAGGTYFLSLNFNDSQNGNTHTISKVFQIIR